MSGARWAGLGVILLGLLALATFAMPVDRWSTGERETAPLPLTRSGAAVPERLWIDTDAACGHGRRSDPDDCLALLRLARAGGPRIVGLSSTFGNAALAVTDRVTREMAERLAEAGTPLGAVARGAAGPLADGVASGPATGSTTEAQRALTAALREGPLTILALGPATNIAATLRAHPDLAARVERVVAVMGRRPGHLFHPAEGRGHGILFGHGPVFSDLNFRKDPAAAKALLAQKVPVTLVPYELARGLRLTRDDLGRIAESGPAGRWLAGAAAGWLGFWEEKVGIDGFYPFDLVAAAYLLAPGRFLCAEAEARVETGWAPDWLWLLDDAGVIVSPAGGSAGASAGESVGGFGGGFGGGRPVTYCPEAAPGAARAVVDALAAERAGRGRKGRDWSVTGA